MRGALVRLALAAAVAFALAACTPSDLFRLLSGAPLGAGSGAVPTAAPFTLAPSAPAASDVPAGWTAMVIPGEKIRWAAPAGWSIADLADVRSQLQSTLDSGSLPEAYRAGLASMLQSIDDGDIRVVIGGPTPGGTATSDVALTIGPIVPDLAAAGAAMHKALAVLPDATESGPERVALALGDGLRYEWVQSDNVPSGYIPARTVAIVTLLRDGRYLWVEGTAPKDDTAWKDFVTRLADQVRVP